MPAFGGAKHKSRGHAHGGPRLLVSARTFRPSRASLRRHDPDQVRRVDARSSRLSAPAGVPLACVDALHSRPDGPAGQGSSRRLGGSRGRRAGSRGETAGSRPAEGRRVSTRARRSRAEAGASRKASGVPRGNRTEDGARSRSRRPRDGVRMPSAETGGEKPRSGPASQATNASGAGRRTADRQKTRSGVSREADPAARGPGAGRPRGPGGEAPPGRGPAAARCRGRSARRRPARRRSSLSWDKRDSVARHHSSGDAVARILERPTRTHRAGHPRTRPYLGLHRVGFTLFTPAAREGRTALGGGGHGLCGTFRRLSPPRRYLAPCPAVSRLSSGGRTPEKSPATGDGVTSRDRLVIVALSPPIPEAQLR